MPPDDETRTLHRADVLVAPLPVILRTATGEKRLASGTCVVGSGSKADLVVDDPAVSRTHAELTLCPEGVHVKDLGSRNGTFYLGQRITSAVLSPGTRITLGSSAVSIDLDADHLAESSPSRGASFRGLYGSSPAMARLFTTLSRLDGSLVPVLVHGESGVGKELVARAIHEGSRVSSGPFVPVNCGAIARELVSSMLFGHTRGAFTGALDARRGAFLAAHGGTLFLDEIGELPLEVQPALLRALESGEIVPVGKDVPQQVRVRIVAATHRDLRALVAEGKFREDLFYRLAVVALEIPPLRDRREDIPELARLFAREEGAADLDDDFVAEMSQHAFPGNVRELRNSVLSYIAIGAMPPARISMFPPSAPPGGGSTFAPRFDAPYLAQRDAIVESFTREYLTKLLEATKGNQSEAARIAGLDRTYLGRMLSKMGIGRK